MASSSLINVNSFKFMVIIPAAGSSERFCASNSSSMITNEASTKNRTRSQSLPPFFNKKSTSSSSTEKQYTVICNKPLIYHTVAAFLKLKWIDHILVMTAQNSMPQMQEILLSLAKQQQKRFNIVPGGSSRHRSIKFGLDFIEAKRIQPDFIIVHDGARPYLDEQVLHRLVSECYQHGVAGVFCPLTSTIIEPQKETFMLNRVLDRSRYVASETPQAFRYNLLVNAYQKCSTDDLDNNTECLDLVKRYCKFDAKLIPVEPSLYFKVTYRKDIYAADHILKEQRNILLHCDFDCEKPNVNYKFIKELKDDLISSFVNVKYFSDSVKLKNTLVAHSPGTVHVLLHYCENWSRVIEQNLAAYENLVYIVVNSDTDEHNLNDYASNRLLKWARSAKSKEIRNFYLIFAHLKDLDQESSRIRNIAVYLSKELPFEFSGQTFFI
ncbi:D-ribitol-5-phosphate cytidylyltransferase [Dermatophagoides farinae]|uniref:D-ribitol-5-phosphate cytidylyltransferase n=1 Tax=Dermatophagoides farinae TaxID=6954 RepID=UPI003F608FA8